MTIYGVREAVKIINRNAEQGMKSAVLYDNVTRCISATSDIEAVQIVVEQIPTTFSWECECPVDECDLLEKTGEYLIPHMSYWRDFFGTGSPECLPIDEVMRWMRKIANSDESETPYNLMKKWRHPSADELREWGWR